MKIIPFTCSACGVEFYKEEGAFCAACHKPFCIIDLYCVSEGENKLYLCEADKGPREGTRGKNETVSIRRMALRLSKQRSPRAKK